MSIPQIPAHLAKCSGILEMFNSSREQIETTDCQANSIEQQTNEKDLHSSLRDQEALANIPADSFTHLIGTEFNF